MREPTTAISSIAFSSAAKSTCGAVAVAAIAEKMALDKTFRRVKICFMIFARPLIFIIFE
ncbi:hypothetical protein [Microbulbifer sp.]|uniref:hypothetical protein n=1 Tax=Microbulbifer sp. TaxID=1908541 RepID=UPI002F950293